MYMKIFITGSTGFLGTHLIKRLAQTSHELRCLARKTSKTEELQRLGVGIVYGDVTDKASLLAGMKGCDWVINLANIYSVWEPDPSVYTTVNIEGTRNVMQAALETGISKVVHVSTVATYGKPYDVPFTEKSSPGPEMFSEYSRTKAEGEKIAWSFYKDKGLPLVIIQPCPILGPGDTKVTGQVIWGIAKQAMPATSFGKAVMTYTHVKDVVEVIIRAADKEGNIGERYIVGKEQLSFDELYLMISEIAGVPLPRLRLPDFVIVLAGKILTILSNKLKLPPQFGLSNDGVRISKEGIRADGSKAERELGIHYTPIREAVKEAVAALPN
jgi:dihydroflavonol-4-reductase